MMGPTLVRGFAPGGIGPRDIASSNNVQGSALGGTTYYGASAEVDFPIFGLPKEIGLKGALFADAGNLIGYSGQTNFSNFLGYTYCPGAERAPDHPAELRQGLGSEPDPLLGRREPDLGLADGSDPVRFRLPAVEGQVRPDADLQLLGRRDVLASHSPVSRIAGASRG